MTPYFAEEEFGALSEKMVYFLIVINKSGQIIVANDPCNIFRYQDGLENDTKHLTDYLIDQDIELYHKTITTLNKENTSTNCSLHFETHNNDVLAIHFNFILYRDQIYATGIRKTISSKQNNKKWLHAIINNGIDYTLLLNTKGEILIADDDSAAIAKRDFNIDPLKTKCLFLEVIPINFRTGFVYYFNETLKGKTIKKEIERVTHTGAKQWLTIKYVPIFDNQQNVESVLVTLQDITEEKLATILIEQAQLKEQELQNLKSNILSNLSHEIRTPLNGIMTISKLLQTEENEKERNKLISYLQESQDRLLETLNTLTGFSEIENLQKNLKYTQVDINYMVESSYREYRHKAKSKNLEYTLDLEESSPEAIIDEKIFKTAVDNIIHNAIKYTDKGSVAVKIKGSKKNIYIYIKDTGIGIDKKNYKKIFDPFIQESIGLNRKYEGTGIGLSLSKRYIEILGGKIKVKSELGKGTEFKIIISKSV